MRYYLSRFIFCSLLLAFTVVIVGCGGPGSGTAPDSIPAALATQTRNILAPGISTLVAQVLANMDQHAWNPQAMTHGVTTGGLFINWKMNNPSVTNAVRPGPDGNTQHNHDPQVDLLYLTALVEYHQLHPQDHTQDTDLRRATALVIADFPSYNLPKGWIYFYLLKDGLTLQNSSLVDEAQRAANNIYTTWYNPTLGVVCNRNHASGDYDTDHTIDSGAALIDAGLRWHRPNWVSAGEKTIGHTISVALDPRYHLFYTSMLVSSDGHDQVGNYQAKPSTQGEAVDALVTAYTLTHQQHYLDVAGQVLQALFGSSGLWDQARGGFFFALEMNTGKLLTAYKETRSQTLTLIGLHHYNQVKQHRLAQQEQQLLTVLTGHFYERVYHGFFYRVTPDFQVYVSKPGAGIGLEDYFTTEAMGSALDALQQTELPQFLGRP